MDGVPANERKYQDETQDIIVDPGTKPAIREKRLASSRALNRSERVPLETLKATGRGFRSQRLIGATRFELATSTSRT